MRIAGWSFGKSKARLALLPAIAIAGCAIWLMLPQASDAKGHSTAAEVTRLTQDISRNEDTAGTLSSPAPGEGQPGCRAWRHRAAGKWRPPMALDGLKIISQSWRRGGLGSKALVTFTLSNASDYAVRDIEIA